MKRLSAIFFPTALLFLCLNPVATCLASQQAAISSSAGAIDFKTLLKTGSDHLRAYFSSGSILDFTAATGAYNRVLLSTSDDKSGRAARESAELMLGILYTRRGQQLANGLEKKGLEKPASYFQLGNLYLTQNRFEEAIGCYEKVNAAIPAWTCPYRHKGEALMKAGRNHEAIVALRKSIEVKKDHFDAYVFLARALVATGSYAEAEKELNMAVDVHTKGGQCAPGDEEEATMKDCWKAYAELYEKWGKPDKAAEFSAKVR